MVLDVVGVADGDVTGGCPLLEAPDNNEVDDVDRDPLPVPDADAEPELDPGLREEEPDMDVIEEPEKDPAEFTPPPFGSPVIDGPIVTVAVG